MGISGLLPLLKDIQVSGHISDFRGKTLAVDAYVWLHKGAFGCAEDLVKGRKTTKFVDYAMHRVRLLKYHGVTPYIVFDGGPLPAKKGTEVSRAKSRAENLERARSFEAQGRWREARDFYTKCVDITPEMAYQLIKALRAENVDYVVAPYEADAQLCFLEREGFVDGIITEDSDLLVFGCRQVIYKLDKDGQCVHIHRDKLACIKEFPMHGWSDVEFRRMAMLSGCDYLDSIPGIGLKTAHRLMRRFHTVEKLLQHVRLEGTMQIPPTYLADFAQAELAFIHQRVYHPGEGRLVPLNDFPEGGLQEIDEKWIGLEVVEHIAKGMAKGDIHPATREPIVDEWPDYKPVAKPKPLAESSKVNTPGAGPMDAFITRMKRPKPALAPPVGTSHSGPSRLSDQVSLGNENLLCVPKETKKSKFFSGSSKRANQAKPEPVELVWDEVDDDPLPSAGPSHCRSQSPSVRSPSPAISSIRAEDSPAKSLFGDAHNLTSPQGPMISSPACSSPQSDTFTFTPRSRKSRRGTRSATPPSPTLASVGSSFIIPSSPRLIPSQSVLSSQAAQTPAKRRPMSRFASILIPNSSPANASFAPTSFSDPPLEDPPKLKRRFAGHTSSSDTISEEEVVTPAIDATNQKKRRRSIKSEPEDEEMDENERQRVAKAKIVAQGWRTKYALGSQSSSPIPGAPQTIKRSKSDPTTKETPRNLLKRSNTSTSTPVPRAKVGAQPLPLATRPINVPRPVRAFVTPRPVKREPIAQKENDNIEFDKIMSPSPSLSPEPGFTQKIKGQEIIIPETQSQTLTETQILATPHSDDSSSGVSVGSGSGRSKLEKYRFNSRVEVSH